MCAKREGSTMARSLESLTDEEIDLICGVYTIETGVFGHARLQCTTHFLRPTCDCLALYVGSLFLQHSLAPKPQELLSSTGLPATAWRCTSAAYFSSIHWRLSPKNCYHRYTTPSNHRFPLVAMWEELQESVLIPFTVEDFYKAARSGSQDSVPKKPKKTLDEIFAGNVMLTLQNTTYKEFPIHERLRGPYEDPIRAVCIPQQLVYPNFSAGRQAFVVEWDDYRVLWKDVQDFRTERAAFDYLAVVGAKGIGKTCSLYWLMDKAIAEHMNVIFQPSAQYAYYLIGGKYYYTTFASDSPEALYWMQNELTQEIMKNTLVLVDAKAMHNVNLESSIWFTGNFLTVFATSGMSPELPGGIRVRQFVLNPPSPYEIAGCLKYQSKLAHITRDEAFITKLRTSLVRFGPCVDVICSILAGQDPDRIEASIKSWLEMCPTDHYLSILSGNEPTVSQMRDMGGGIVSIIRLDKSWEKGFIFTSHIMRKLFFDFASVRSTRFGLENYMTLSRSSPLSWQFYEGVAISFLTNQLTCQSRWAPMQYREVSSKDQTLKSDPSKAGRQAFRQYSVNVEGVPITPLRVSMDPTSSIAIAHDIVPSPSASPSRSRSRSTSIMPPPSTPLKRPGEPLPGGPSSSKVKREDVPDERPAILVCPPSMTEPPFWESAWLAEDNTPLANQSLVEGVLYLPTRPMNALFDAIALYGGYVYVYQMFDRLGEAKHSMKASGIPKVLALAGPHEVIFVSVVPGYQEAGLMVPIDKENASIKAFLDWHYFSLELFLGKPSDQELKGSKKRKGKEKE
ncbi:hypothetical protein C8R43DRAFT_952227 [Mycena crocata]|nr:hypothetical protein C8R43DRAFT_952227 [Mycena crocata]